MTTRPYEFPASRTESTGAGPDFPGSAGDRERGKFRPSATPRLTQIAVVGDDGRPVALTTEQLLADLVLWQKVTVVLLLRISEDSTLEDVVNEASRL